VMIITRTHPITQIETYGKTMSSIGTKVEIKRGVWIGAGAIILPNVTIGERAVVVRRCCHERRPNYPYILLLRVFLQKRLKNWT